MTENVGIKKEKVVGYTEWRCICGWGLHLGEDIGEP